MARINFGQLKSDLKQATQCALTEVLAKVPGQKLAGFALYSDAGAMSVSPAANSVTNLKQNAKEEDSDAEYYKWTLAEWDHEGYGGAAHFAKICSEIFSGVRDLSVEDFDEFRNRLFETCVNVLEEMRMEGAFRDISPKAVLVFSVTDYEHAQREKEWIARLNAAARAREFADWIDGLDAEA